jgi:hypothetical protein
MRDRDSFDRIRSLIKSYRGKSDSDFSGDFRRCVAETSLAGPQAAEAAELLNQLRLTLERWYADPPDSLDPVADWLRLFGASKDRLPISLLETLLSRIPTGATKTIDWSPIVLGLADPAALSLLVTQKHLKVADLEKIAEAHPSEFYRSAGLDVLLKHGGSPPRTIWASITTLEERKAGLLPGPEALAEAFSSDTSSDASRWILHLLADNAPIRPAILLQLLRDSAALEKLARYLSVAALGLKGKKKATVEAMAEPVIHDLTELCVRAVEEGRRTAPSATWVIGMLAVAAHSSTTPLPVSAAKTVELSAGRIARIRILALLRSADDGSSVDKLPVVAPAEQLYTAVQEYLHGLPSGPGGDSEPAERSTRYQRYVGRSEVIREFLPMLQTSDDAPIPRNAVGAALFNVGLRPLGVSEGVDTFDSHRHQPAISGILPGDKVKIIRPGWQLGDDEGAVVLEKARVTTHE